MSPAAALSSLRRPFLVCLVFLACWAGLDAVAALLQTRAGVSLWYLPAGLGLALLLLFGTRFTPVLLLTEPLHSLLVGEPPLSGVAVAVRGLATTAAYGGAAWVLLHRARIDPRLRSQRDVLWFLGVGCLAAPLLVAVVQIVQLNLSGVLRWRDVLIDVFGSWSGAATGIGVVAPPLLVLARSRRPGQQLGTTVDGEAPTVPRRDGPATWQGVAEGTAQAALLLLTGYLAFGPPAGGRLDLATLIYLPLLWIAVRGGFVRVVAALLAVNLVAVVLVGPVVQEDPLRLQLGLMAMTLAGLALGALVTQRRTDVEAALHAAVHDPLTGLANRVLLTDRLVAAVQRHAREPEAAPALLYVDLDGFKSVNDDLGHDAGDELLVAVAQRLEQTVRPGDLVSRLGGDELVVLLDGVDPERAADIAERARAALRRPYAVAGREVVISASIGVALADSGPEAVADRDAEGAAPARDRRPGARLQDRSSEAERIAAAVLRAADAALQQAKLSGGDRVELFSPPLREQARDRLRLQAALRAALAQGGITVAYQPVVALPTGALVAVEVLARWHEPARGPVEPTVFVAAAERTGLIHDLGRRVLDMACADVAAWRRAGGPHARLAVNVSPRQLLADGLAEEVLATVERHGLAPGDLELEVTESGAMAGDPASSCLQALTCAGVRLAVDDFGTGWSSFARLRDLAPQTLKLDRSFTAALGRDTASTAIVQAVLAMAEHLGTTVTAEGVETEEQLELLRRLGCPQVQGYLLGRPMSAHELQRTGLA